MIQGSAGPVEVVTIGFPGNEFRGEIVPAVQDLLTRELIRILDLLFVFKDTDGAVGSMEVSDLGPSLQPAFVGVGGHVEGGLLDRDDVEQVAAELDANSSIALLVVEHVWAAPFVDAVRNAGGQVLERARLPADLVRSWRARPTDGDVNGA